MKDINIKNLRVAVMPKDVFIKDEGDFITVGFVSDKAKAYLALQPIEVKKHLYGSLDGVRKLDLHVSQLPMVERSLTACDLTWEEV